MKRRRALLFWVLFVFGGCALHAVPFTEPVVGHAMVWEESSTAFPRADVFEIIARGTKPLSQRIGITTEDARATLEKAAPYCAPIILRPASPTTANFTIVLGRRGLFTHVMGWRTGSACRDGLAKMKSAELRCAPAFLIQAPSRISMELTSVEETKP